jgi:PAS domain S-box-containing protein
MKRTRAKNLIVLSVAVLLTGLGVYNIFLKATWTLLEDGVFWKATPAGVVASRIAPGGPAALAGVKVGDVLLAVNGEEVLTHEQVQARLARRASGDRLSYSILRAEERRSLEVVVKPLPKGNASLFYYLSLVGFFSLVVGTIVMLRRPPDRAALHFYAICLLFFLMYSTSYTGKLNLADWTLLWTDHLAVLLLPVVFLHFCVSFPERRLSDRRAWLVLVAYMPALALAGAAVLSQVLFATTQGGQALWRVTAAIDRSKPLYFALLFAVSFAILLDSYRKTRSLTARKQMKWLVWGTGSGVLPFFAFYAVPFALGREPRFAMELAGYIPLALIPLSLAYAVVKHRLMDVELIFRRALVYLLATAAIVGICLLVVGLYSSAVRGDEEPHVTLIAVLSTLVVMLLFTPVKSRIQDAIDRLFYRRDSPRRALLRLSQDLNAGLDLRSMTDQLLRGVRDALGVQTVAAFLPERDGAFAMFSAMGCGPGVESIRLPATGALARRLAEGSPVNAESAREDYPEAGPLDLVHYFPCRVKGELIAILGVGRKDGFDTLNSEEIDLLQALAGQAATAFMNGRLFQSLREKAEELQRLTEYNQNILESMDSGILVLDLDGRIVRWNRAMESLDGRRREEVLGRTLDEVFPAPFLDALRGSLVMEDHEEIAHIYKLHLLQADGRSVIVNVSIAPFEVDSGERHGTVLILEDVTARIRLEDQLQHAEKMASIGLLAAGVAHEVNTPLTGISSYAQILLEDMTGDDPRRATLEKIEAQTRRASSIANSLLNLARPERSAFETLPLNDAVHEVLKLFEPQIRDKKILLHADLGGGVPDVRGHRAKLQQVLLNLLSNARDAVEGGGHITVRTSQSGERVLLEVVDDGIGIAEEDLPHIFDPFFTTKGRGKGTGLGLSISYGIVREHDGAMQVESIPGEFTRFRVELPVHKPARAFA